MSISHSVGEGAFNQSDDVRRVQSLLNEFRLEHGQKSIAEDGKVGPETIGAILDFQKGFMGTPDGRVDPDGSSIKKLEELAAPKIFQAAMLGLLGAISAYDPRTRSIHSDAVISDVFDSIRRDDDVA